MQVELECWCEVDWKFSCCAVLSPELTLHLHSLFTLHFHAHFHAHFHSCPLSQLSSAQLTLHYQLSTLQSARPPKKHKATRYLQHSHCKQKINPLLPHRSFSGGRCKEKSPQTPHLKQPQRQTTRICKANPHCHPPKNHSHSLTQHNRHKLVPGNSQQVHHRNCRITRSEDKERTTLHQSHLNSTEDQGSGNCLVQQFG